MPNCFQLLRKATPEAGPVKLIEVDAEMCAHFGVPCYPTDWHAYWYDTVGLGLALGKTFAELLLAEMHRYEQAKAAGDADNEAFANHQCEIIVWLDANFTADAWYQPKSPTTR